MTTSELARAAWFPFSDEPVLENHWYLPHLGSPSVLPPGSSPDGRWHLFTQTWLGIQHFSSQDGVSWIPLGRMPMKGDDPCIVGEKGCWYLFTVVDGREVVYQESEDLVHWLGRKVAFQAEEGHAIGHPRLCKVEGLWRLYYTDGMVRETPRSVWTASSHMVFGPYGKGESAIEADADDPLVNMGVGAFSLLPCEDGVGLVSSASHWERRGMRSESSLILFSSQDGLHFGKAREILAPLGDSWTFLGVDGIYKGDEGTWYCYYSVMEKGPLSPSSIGLLLGRNPQDLYTV